MLRGAVDRQADGRAGSLGCGIGMQRRHLGGGHQGDAVPSKNSRREMWP
jgi:hypothetical protein